MNLKKFSRKCEYRYSHLYMNTDEFYPTRCKTGSNVYWIRNTSTAKIIEIGLRYVFAPSLHKCPAQQLSHAVPILSLPSLNNKGSNSFPIG